MLKAGLVAVALSLFGSTQVQAQAPAPAQQPKLDLSADAVMKRVAPEKQDGQPIAKDDRVWAGVVAVVGFLFAVGLTRGLIRVLAELLIVGIIGVGGLWLWSLTSDGRLNTWQAVATAAAIVGAAAGTVIAVVGLFALERGPSRDEHKSVANAQYANQAAVERLSGEVERLKAQLAAVTASRG